MGLVYIWQDTDKRWTKDVLAHVKALVDSNKELVVLHCNNLLSEGACHLLEYMLQICKDLKLLQNSLTFLSAKDHLFALELCISALKKKNNEDTTNTTDEELLACHKAYAANLLKNDELNERQTEFVCAYNDLLRHSNCTDLWQLYSILWNNKSKLGDLALEHSFLFVGNLNPTFKMFIKFFSSDGNVNNVTVETPLDISVDDSSPNSPSSSKHRDVTVNCEPIMIDDVKEGFVSAENHGSATLEYSEEVILAYLSLLVNCRNEMALSKAMISPIIDLSHEAFTDLKHLSAEKDMPMCQTVISYVTKIRLGGKGYAPPASCPLLKHLKQLEVFVDLLNKLQTIAEEDKSVESALKRGINILKNRLLNSKSEKLEKKDLIVQASEDLITTALRLHNTRKNKVDNSSNSQFGQLTFNILNTLVNHVACICAETSAEEVLGQKKMERTPLNLPPLLGYFRSPEDESNSCENSLESLQVQEEVKIVSLPPVSYFHCSNSNSHSLCTEAKTPVKTSFKGCFPVEKKAIAGITLFSDPESIKTKVDEAKKVQAKQSSKRSKLSDISNKGNDAKKAKVAPGKPKATKTLKTKAQIKGQGSIKNFFMPQ